MDGVTYKDWAKYHLLKDRFDEWQEDLKQLIVTHPSLEAAQNEEASSKMRLCGLRRRLPRNSDD